MLHYGTNIALLKPLPELAKPKPKPSKFWSFIHAILDFIGEIIVGAIVEVVNFLTFGIKVVGQIVEVVLGTIKDITVDLITGKKIDWKQVGKNALWRAGTISYAYAAKKFSTFIKTIKQSKHIKTISKIEKIGKQVTSFIKNPASLFKYMANKATYHITKALQKTSIMKKLLKKYSFKQIKHFIQKSIRYATLSTSLTIGFINSKDKSKFVFDRSRSLLRLYSKKWTKSIINKTTNKYIQKLAKKDCQSVQKYQNALKRNSQTWIKFTSSWIDGVKIASTDWIENENDSFISYYVFFNPTTTKNKNPLLFINRPISEFNSFLTATSKGKYYLDNFAWGWEIGRAIRRQDKKVKNNFWISKLENQASKYNQHFLNSISEFDNTTQDAIEVFRNQFKVLSSTRNRRLGNRIVVEFDNKNVRFYKKMTEQKFNRTFRHPDKIRRTLQNIKIRPKKL